MSLNWEKVKLGDISSMQYGYGASAKMEEIGPKFLRITDIVPDLIDWSTVPFCEISAADYNKYKVKKGDILVARTGATAGYAKLIRNDVDAVFAGYLIRIIPNENCSKQFLGRLIESSIFKDFVDKVKGGAAQPQANAPVLKEFEFNLPELDIQQKIASILSSYDKLIENNTRRIEILEEMAQRIYKEWFVDFKYPGHENDELVDSEQGMIPEGWVIDYLDNLALTTDYVANGSFAALKENVNLYDKPEYALYIRKKDYSSNFLNLKYVDKSSYDFLKKSELHGDEFIISNVGDVGTVFKAPTWLEKPMTLGSNSILVRSKEYNNYLFYFFKSHLGQYKINSIVSGSAQPKFNKTEFRKLKLLIPMRNLIESFDTIINTISNQLNILNKKQINLKNTRDYLLPKLISGKVDVSDLDIDTGILDD